MTRRAKATADELEAMAARTQAFEGSPAELMAALQEDGLSSRQTFRGGSYEFRLMGVGATATNGPAEAMRAWRRAARREAARRRAS